ncbi:MAG: glycosyltransferase family 4 protein [Myxococcales bacterium]|nr:glycosyltransferase family 4 protein [Myxococcales bacterium]
MSATRRVLMSADTVGGVWSYAIELARALARHGTEVVLAAFGGRASPEQARQAAAVDNLVLFDAPWKCEWMDDPWDDLAHVGDWLLELAARSAPDVVHLNHYAHGGLPWPAPLLMVGHSDVLSWFRAVRGHEAPPSWDRYRDVVGRGLRAAAHVVAPTEAMLRSLAGDFGPFARATVIPNGCDALGFRASDDKPPFIFAAGRMWDDGKNLAALDAAAPRLRWPVVVAGSTAHPDGGKKELRHVRALGACERGEMAELYARAAIYALPARYEPFGLSILEAALAGCALVLGDIPSLRESWSAAAQFVPPDDPDALVAAVDRLIDDAALRRDYARAAHARARSLSSARMAAAYAAAYAALVPAATEAVCA